MILKLKKIRFKNYRCFLDGEVEFPESFDKRNINLLIGPNGSGKTEFLFSIWWTFYPNSIKFSDLKGKEATNYSLNSDLYFQLNNGPVGGKKECFVEIEFEFDNETYVLRRTETFEKKSLKKPTGTLSCSLYKIDMYGITTPPLTDEIEVNSRLERILPQKVLSGIIFDGERMMKISSINDDSARSIEGVISDITNKEVLVSFDNELAFLKQEYQKSITRLARKMQSMDLEEVAKELGKKDAELTDKKIKIAEINNEIPALELRLQEISDQLKALEESALIEEKLKIASNDLKHYQENYEKDLETFRKQLSKEGPQIIINKLVSTLDSIVKYTNVPLGLNAKVVENILEKDTCICGTPFSHEMRKHLFELQKKLPPNDINASIKEKTKLIQMNAKRVKERIRELYISLDDNYQKINKTSLEIIELKTQLSESVSEQVVKLQSERGKIEERLNVAINKKNNLNIDIEKLTREIDKLKEIQQSLTKDKSQLNSLQSKKDFLEKSIKAIKEIQEKYRMIALTEINEFFKKAYKEISEDYSNGRRAYLTHRLNNKYYMVTYNENDLINYLSDTKGYSKEEFNLNQIDLDELEKAINTIKISNSTGQQTVLSLAFVKAILDYSRKMAEEKDKELKKTKSYPVVIDAPFSDLSGDNLKNAAANLYSFSEQVILLISPTSYENIKEDINEHINSINIFNKNNKGQYSTIEKGVVKVD